MFNFKKTKLFFLLIGLFLLSACSVSFGSGTSNQAATASNVGGVLKSSDKGETWTQKSSLLSIGGQKRDFSSLDINKMTFDPSDDNTLYFASISNGLLYSYDDANSWSVAKSLGPINVVDVGIDPESKCRIYVAAGNRVYRTEDILIMPLEVM